MKIVVVNGSGRVGKDTFVDFCMGGKLNYCKISTIDFCKDVAEYCGWDGEKTDKNRKFLSDLKRIMMEWDDLPYQDTISGIKYMEEDLSYYYGVEGVYFIFSREIDEIKRFVKDFDAITVKIINPLISQITTNESDAQVNDYEYDVVIVNDGTLDDLKEKAKQFCIDYLK